MAKLNCAQVRERTLELVQSSTNGMPRADIERRIKEESPETPSMTISVQVNEAARKYSHLIQREDGYYRPRCGPAEKTTLRSSSSPGPDRLENTTFTLVSLGFVPVGHWDYDGPHLRRNLAQHADRSPALYAFVIDGAVMYLGKTVQRLFKRLDLYAHPESHQTTNIRNHAAIRAALDAGRRVEIWALVDWESIEHRGIPINVAAGVEDALIQRMRPDWNRKLTGD